ncbi:MAG: hypothetical protein Q4D81_14520, partial [Eubacteriales bacterium]|nr:hypothetical protein [Eubacteriales bacterium]
MYRKLVGIMLSVMIAASGCAGASMGTASAGGQGAAEARTEAAGGQESAEARTDAAGGQEAGKAQAEAGAAADGATAESGAAAENGSTAGTGAEAAPAAGAAAKEISPEDVTVTWEDSRVYPDLTLGRYKVITTYGVKGYEDVPFIRASDYLDILFDGRQKVFVEDGVMKVDMRGARAEIDPETDTVLFENPAGFMSTGAIDGAIIEKNEYNVITASVKNKSVQTESKPVAVDLRGYRMPVIPYDGDILMPFLALQNTFGSIAVNNGLAYNGKDYFNVFGTDQFIMTEENAAAADSPYRKAIYSGPFSTREETSQAYADYGYYSTCLLLDLTFGHKEERNITTFDEYFTRMNAKKALCSTRPAIAMTVELMLFSYLFDSGHDALIGTDSVFGRIDGVGKEEVDSIIDEIKESDEAGELFDDAAGISPEDQEISVDAIVGALLEKGLKAPEIVSLIGWSLWL